MGRVQDLTALADSKPFIKRSPQFFSAIRFQETVFALPFAYTGMILAADGLPTFYQFMWITVAMVSARTFGMAFNRVADRHIDARNPRTASRHLPSKKLRVSDLAILSAVALGLFFAASAMLNKLALVLAPVAAMYLALYPFSKRFTWTANLLLGLALAIAPSAAWIGVRGSLDWEPVLLSVAVASWAASFDIIYHTQDHEFYSRDGLYSIAQRFGSVAAFRWAKALDVIAVGSLFVMGQWMELSFPYYLGCVISIGLLVAKYRLVSPTDMSRVTVAFFRINAYISSAIFAATLVSILFD